MKNLTLSLLLVLLTFIGCKKSSPEPDSGDARVTSPEYIDGLLFVNKNNYQISTKESATFSSTDPKIQITSSGLIKRLVSGEITPITITWANDPSNTTTIYALGATDTEHDEPYASFHGRLATDPYAAYLLGWKTLQRLPFAGETYALVLRHADADNGKDFTMTTGPANWWKSCDPKIARQLNTRGEERSAELGRILKDLQFPFTRVISSEFCRAVKTAQLIDAGPTILIDGRINHMSYNLTGDIFPNIITVLKDQPVDNKMTLIVTHHPGNESNNRVPTFPAISPFNWTGGYFVRITPTKTVTYEGAVSWPMFKYWRDKKMNAL